MRFHLHFVGCLLSLSPMVAVEGNDDRTNDMSVQREFQEIEREQKIQDQYLEELRIEERRLEQKNIDRQLEQKRIDEERQRRKQQEARWERDHLRE